METTCNWLKDWCYQHLPLLFMSIFNISSQNADAAQCLFYNILPKSWILPRNFTQPHVEIIRLNLQQKWRKPSVYFLVAWKVLSDLNPHRCASILWKERKAQNMLSAHGHTLTHRACPSLWPLQLFAANDRFNCLGMCWISLYWSITSHVLWMTDLLSH